MKKFFLPFMVLSLAFFITTSCSSSAEEGVETEQPVEENNEPEQPVEGNVVYATKDNIAEVVSSLTSDATIVVTGELTGIGSIERAFENSSYKINLDLSQVTGLTRIRNEAFLGSNVLSSITIPNSVTSVGGHLFEGCSFLKRIEVDANSTSFTSVDGVLFNKDKTVLFCYPAGKEALSYTIPDSVTVIKSEAFSYSKLNSIAIPGSVTSIGYYAFSYSKLNSIAIPSSVTSIGYDAFYDCSNLTSLTFSNTSNWYRVKNLNDFENRTNGTETDLSNPETNATNFTGTYMGYHWYKL